MTRILFLSLLFTAFSLHGLKAVAAEICSPTPEAIFKMITPEYPSNAIWDSVYGAMDAQERFIGAMMLDSGQALAVGEQFKAGNGEAALVVAEIDSYGRVVNEQVNVVKGLRGLNKMLPRKEGFVVLGRSRTGQTSAESWLGFFDKTGKMQSTKAIRSGKFSIEAQDIVPMQGGNGYMMAASEQERGGARHSVIFRLDVNGNVTLRRAFNPGPDNTILSLSAAGKDHYLGSGYLRAEDGRKTGWLVLFNKNAEIVWERQYPRGRESLLSGAIDYNADHMVVLGESVPAGGGNRAGWVMMINRSDGDIIWQRYYTGYLDYMARDVLISPNNVISILLDSNVPDKESDEETEKQLQPSVRLLSLNPRGEVLQNDEFTNGEGTHAYRMIRGPNDNRMIVGSTAMIYAVRNDPPAPVPVVDEKAGPIISPVKSMEKVPEPPKEEVAEVDDDKPPLVRSMDGWMIAALPALPYKDPCVPR